MVALTTFKVNRKELFDIVYFSSILKDIKTKIIYDF